MRQDIRALSRKGHLLEILNTMSNVERQVVYQSTLPTTSIPEELVSLWFDVFNQGFGLEAIGFGEEALTILLDFDFELEDWLSELTTLGSTDRIEFIRTDSIWQAICELAEDTLSQLAELGYPPEITFSDS